MRTARIVGFGVIGVVVPVALAIAAYFLSVRFGVSTSVPGLPAGVQRDVNRPADDETPSAPTSPRATACGDSFRDRLECASSATPTPTASVDDRGGRSSGRGGSDDSGTSGRSGPSGRSGSHGGGGDD